MRWNCKILILYGLVALIPLVSITSGQGKGKGGGGGDDEGYGNNLSVPAIFAEDRGVTGYLTSESTGLRPLPGEAPAPFFDPAATFIKDGITFYPQQTTSTWVAGWRKGASSGERVVVNWSDNLVKQVWTPRSVIRVETILYQNGTDTMKAYPMTLLYGSGTTEMYGARGESSAMYQSYRTVFSANAALRIEKISAPGTSIMAKPVTPGLPFESAVYQGFGLDGPGAYGAEVNVSGNLIYGFNWMLNQWTIPDSEKLGWWRITFKILPTVTYSLGGATQVVNRNVYLDSLDAADTVSGVLFKPVLVSDKESYIDIEIVANRSGGGNRSSGKEDEMNRLLSVATMLLLGPLLAWTQGGPGSGGSGGAGGSGGGGSPPAGLHTRVTTTTAQVTIEGVVAAVHISYGLEYPSIEVNNLLVKVAPVWFLLENDFELVVGDLVIIQALPCHNTADTYYYAVTISKLDPVTKEVLASIVLRDSNGLPLWIQSNVQIQPQGAQRCATSTLPCVTRFSAVTVTGTVERSVLQSDGIRHPLLYLKAEDGKLLSIRLGPAETIFGADFELRAGETVTVRYALSSRTRERVALDIGYGSGTRLMLRNEAGGPTWISSH